MIRFFEHNQLLSTQHELPPQLSTETALTTITHEVFDMDLKKVTILTLCDPSKTFDCIYHEILLYKCTKLNIDVIWFKSCYLHGRKRSLRLSNTLSNVLNMDYGVLQPSLLPLSYFY